MHEDARPAELGGSAEASGVLSGAEAAEDIPDAESVVETQCGQESELLLSEKQVSEGPIVAEALTAGGDAAEEHGTAEGEVRGREMECTHRAPAEIQEEAGVEGRDMKDESEMRSPIINGERIARSMSMSRESTSKSKKTPATSSVYAHRVSNRDRFMGLQRPPAPAKKLQPQLQPLSGPLSGPLMELAKYNARIAALPPVPATHMGVAASSEKAPEISVPTAAGGCLHPRSSAVEEQPSVVQSKPRAPSAMASSRRTGTEISTSRNAHNGVSAKGRAESAMATSRRLDTSRTSHAQLSSSRSFASTNVKSVRLRSHRPPHQYGRPIPAFGAVFSPGPVHSLPSTLGQGRKFTLKSRIETNPKDKELCKMPGPGQYNPREPNDVRKISLHGRIPVNLPRAPTPGPGSYNIDEATGIGSSMIMKKHGVTLKSRIPPQAAENGAKSIPGPGTYDIPSTVGDGPQFVFGTAW
eukprot:ANDGO_07790.mRNA.1 hypothetical protein